MPAKYIVTSHRPIEISDTQRERNIERTQRTLQTVEDMKAWAQWIGAFILFSLAILGVQALWGMLV